MQDKGIQKMDEFVISLFPRSRVLGSSIILAANIEETKTELAAIGSLG